MMHKYFCMLSATLAITVAMHTEPSDFFCNLSCADFEYKEFMCQQECIKAIESVDELEDCLETCFDLVTPCQDACHTHFHDVFNMCSPKCSIDDKCLQDCFVQEFHTRYEPKQ